MVFDQWLAGEKYKSGDFIMEDLGYPEVSQLKTT